MNVPIYTVDAFTAEPFAGNPAGVCLLGEPAPDDWLAKVAAEMNLPETAFAHGDGDRYHLRWFTPTVEVPLCGHATLATAHVLWESGRADPEALITFDTASGALTAARRDGMIELDFPARPAVETPAPPGLAAALGAEARWVGLAVDDWVIELDSPEQVRDLSPDFDAIAAIAEMGLAVTAAGGDGDSDFTSRYFAPAVGIPEDPATGSVHCTLATYWAPRLGRDHMVGHQASARGGRVRVRLDGDRVALAGNAVTVLAGTIRRD